MTEFETLGEFKPIFEFKDIGNSLEGTITEYKTVNTKFNKPIGIITIENYAIYEIAGLKIYELKQHIGRHVRITYTSDKYSDKYHKNFKIFKVELAKVKSDDKEKFKNLSAEGFKL